MYSWPDLCTVSHKMFDFASFIETDNGLGLSYGRGLVKGIEMRRTRLNIVPPQSKADLDAVNQAQALSTTNGQGHNGAVINEIAMNANEIAHIMSESRSETRQVTTTMANSFQPHVIEVPMTKETRTDRVRRLQEEARLLAKEQVIEFERALNDVTQMAEEIADGGDMYPVGAREICRRLAEELPRSLQTLQAISKKGY